MINIPLAQRLLTQHSIDGWLLYDFRRSNPIVHRLLNLDPTAHYTRRFALWIPPMGEPTLLISRIEAHLFECLPFAKRYYVDRNQWYHTLKEFIGNSKRIAAEYSPFGQLPSVSFLDAGTAEYIRALGVEIISSADLVQHLEAVWTEEQIKDNHTTAQLLRNIMLETIHYAADLARNSKATEYDIQQFILRAFSSHSLITDHAPIVAVGVNTANPHYEPHPHNSEYLHRNTLLLVDMWAKSSQPNATYADITWVAWLGSSPPEIVRSICHIVIAARDAAIALVSKRFTAEEPVYGYEVDDAARNIITEAGYGEYFIHRTGHNIGTEVHGFGANMDNFESQDTRRIIPGTSFSIEPGIYVPGQFGIRSECNIVIDHKGNVHIPSAPLQDDLIVCEV